MARNALRDDLYTAHAALTRDVLTVTDSGTPEQRLAAWVARNESAVARAAQTLVEIWESDAFTVATLSVAVRAIRTLVASSTLPAELTEQRRRAGCAMQAAVRRLIGPVSRRLPAWQSTTRARFRS